MTTITPLRLTQHAAGGGCACKIPPGELEALVRGLRGPTAPDLLVGLDDGDDEDDDEQEEKGKGKTKDKG